MTFRHSHHKNGILKSERLNVCFQFLEPTIGSCERALTEACRTVHGVIMLVFLYVETTAIFKLEK